MVKVKQPTPITDVSAATSTSEAPTGTGSTSSQQPTTSTEPTQGPSAALDQVRQGSIMKPQLTHSLQGTHADATSLKLLQVSELLAWMSNNKLSVPKSKHKDGASYTFWPPE